MIDRSILNALVARLAESLAPPRQRLHPFVVDGVAVGAMDDNRRQRLRHFAEVFDVGDAVRFRPQLRDAVARSEAMARVARTLEEEGALTAWRDERYAVRERFDDPALFLLERAAARYFGIRTFAAHVNGTTIRRGRPAMWLARRSPAKAIDPGKLDNLVGGGVAEGASVAETALREAWEEAGIPGGLAAPATWVATLSIFRAQPDGIQRETIFAHDLALPDTFVPSSQDGEVVEFRLVEPPEAARLASLPDGEDAMTADAALVVADWLVRHGEVPGDHPAAALLPRIANGDFGG